MKGVGEVETYEYIEEFIIAIQEEYPELDIKYQYDEEIDEYEMSYNTSDFDYDEVGLDRFLQKTANDMLFNNGIFNIHFGDEYFAYN